MTLSDHFTIGQKVNAYTEPDPDDRAGTVLELREDDYTIRVGFGDDATGYVSHWYDAHAVLDSTYADLDAWMRDSDYEWRDGEHGAGWYDIENGHGPYEPELQYAAAIGALG